MQDSIPLRTAVKAWCLISLQTFGGPAGQIAVIVAQPVVRVGKKALGHLALRGLAVAALVALVVFAIPFPLVAAAAGQDGSFSDGG